MLQRNEDRVKKGDVNNSNLVLEQAIELSADLKEDEQLGLQGQKGLTSIVEKQKVLTRKKSVRSRLLLGQVLDLN
jgi:hypothetical protein